MRALGVDPRKDIADFEQDFPELAEDVRIPAFCDKEEKFSSVMRLASRGVQLWTHYDVSQVEKRIIGDTNLLTSPASAMIVMLSNSGM